MAMPHPDIESFSFAAETAGTAAAAGLRRIRPLSEERPASRIFDAIASMAKTSDAASVEYEKAAIAALRDEIAKAEEFVAKANKLADDLTAALDNQTPVPLPAFFKKKR
jgi:hypothetical protein